MPPAVAPPDGTYEFNLRQLSDHQGSIVAVLQQTTPTNWRMVDEVEYDPYGRPRRTQQGDFNRNGSKSVQDIFDFLDAYFAGSPTADVNDNGGASGGVTVQDTFDNLSEYFYAESTVRDRISGWGVSYDDGEVTVAPVFIDNPYGYCGYYFDAETAAAKVLGPPHAGANGGPIQVHGPGGLYHVRFRVYDPWSGRWLTRDPAGFVDGSNLYGYCRSSPSGLIDPWGLAPPDQHGYWYYVFHPGAQPGSSSGEMQPAFSATERFNATVVHQSTHANLDAIHARINSSVDDCSFDLADRFQQRHAGVNKAVMQGPAQVLKIAFEVEIIVISLAGGPEDLVAGVLLKMAQRGIKLVEKVGGKWIGRTDNGDEVSLTVTETGAIDDAVSSSMLSAKMGSRGQSPADKELIAALEKRGYKIFDDADTQVLLDAQRANASTDLAGNISLRPDAKHIEVMEEYLHNIMHSKGMYDGMTEAQKEIMTKEWMIRHQKMLGISPEDAAWLQRSADSYKTQNGCSK